MFQKPIIVVDEFNSLHYTGGDVSIFINDIFIDEQVQFVYRVSQTETPLVNYDDYTVSRYHSGVRTISGQMAVNLRNPSYLFNVLNVEKPVDTGFDKLSSSTTVSKLGSANNIIKNINARINSNTSSLLNTQPALSVSNKVTYFTRSESGANTVHTVRLVLGLNNTEAKIIKDENQDFRYIFGEQQGKIFSEGGNQTKLNNTNFLQVKEKVFFGVKFTEESISFSDDGKPSMMIFSFVAKDCTR